MEAFERDFNLACYYLNELDSLDFVSQVPDWYRNRLSQSVHDILLEFIRLRTFTDKCEIV